MRGEVVMLPREEPLQPLVECAERMTTVYYVLPVARTIVEWNGVYVIRTKC